MFNLRFVDVPVAVSKINKRIKSKKGYSLTAAIDLIESIKPGLQNAERINVIVTNTEDGLDYEFENLVISRDSSSLLDLITEDIAESGHEDANKIINQLESEYRLERAGRNETKSKSKNKKRSFGIFKSKSKEEDETVSASAVEDFAGINDDIDSNQDFQGMDDFQESQEQEDASSSAALNNFIVPEQTEEDYPDYRAEFISEPEEVNPDYTYVDENQLADQYESTSYYEEEQEVVAPFQPLQDEDEDVPLMESEPKVQPERTIAKHEKVEFPVYDKYLDLNELKSTIKRFSDRFENDNLIKFLNLNATTPEAAQNALDLKKLSYAKNALDDTEFMLIKDYFFNAIGTIQDETKRKLSQIYEQAMLLDYEEEAYSKLQDEFNSLLEEKEQNFQKYNEEQQREFDNKVESFVLNQEKELEDFKRKQELEKAAFIKDLENKKSSIITVYKENMQQEIDKSKEHLLDDKLYELKSQSVNELSEAKRIALRDMENKLEETIDEIWDKLQENLAALRTDIQNNIPVWNVEIEKQQQKEQALRDEEIRREQLELDRQKVALQRQALENGGEKPATDTDIVKAVETAMQRYQQQWGYPQYAPQPNPMYMQYAQPAPATAPIQPSSMQHAPDMQVATGTAESTVPKKSKNLSLKWLAIGAAVVVGGGSVIGTQVFADNETEPANSKVEESTQYDDLATSIEALEQKVTVPAEETQKEENKELDQLLSEKNYETAANEYNDTDSLNKIETALFIDGALDELKSFHETNKTMFGELDIAILSKDDDKAIKLYEGLSEEEKEALTKERKEKLALSLYEKGKQKEAKSLLDEKK